MAKKRNLNIIDLFCGCGGMSLGFDQEKYNILLGIDIWNDALSTYKLNHKKTETICADLSTLTTKQINEKIGGNEVDVVIGGPPCQGFSIAGKRIIEDKRNELYKSFVRVVEFFQPKAFVLENVPNILSMGNGIIKDSIINDFSNIGYTVVYKVLLASDFGVPQNRRRAFFVGLLNNKTFNFPQALKNNLTTSEEAISDLPEYSVVDGACYPNAPQSEYQSYIRKESTGIYNHEITNHSSKTTDIISMVPDGGNYKNLPANLQLTRKVHIAWTRINSKKPSITIDTGHRHHFHYKYNRIPTVRESARLQSFPDTFIFTGSKTSQYKQVGNAVPPIIAQKIAKQLLKEIQ